MLDKELDRVFANRELVKAVTMLKRREGMVDTPEMLELSWRAGRERMKICDGQAAVTSFRIFGLY